MTWGKQNTEAEAHEQLSYAFDYGLNFMDTAGGGLDWVGGVAAHYFKNRGRDAAGA